MYVGRVRHEARRQRQYLRAGHNGDDFKITLDVLRGVLRVPVKLQVLRNVTVPGGKPLVKVNEAKSQMLGEPRTRRGLARPSGTDETNHVLGHFDQCWSRLPNANVPG